MKVLFLNTSDSKGGASIAAYRLLNALSAEKIETSMLVLHKNRTSDSRVVSINRTRLNSFINKVRFAVERLVIFFSSKWNKENIFKVSIANTGTDISHHPLVVEADMIHLHWINQGFLSLHDIKKLTELKKPILWTMHDMWPITGICHYSWECKEYQNTCGCCPFLHSNNKQDLSYHILQKKKFISTSGIHLVAVSSWLKDMADKSSIAKGLDISVIGNVIDITIFKPSDKEQVRKALSLPMNKDIILMGAAKINDPIKGFDFLKQATLLLKDRSNLLLLLFGDIKNESDFLKRVPIECVYMGSLSDIKTIANLYAAADVTIVPSHYETFGQTLIESMACGCPVVSFDNSGQTDIIDHKQNGYLAKYQKIEDLANGIEWILSHPNKPTLSKACVEKVKANYSESIIAEKYIALYNQLLNKATSQ